MLLPRRNINGALAQQRSDETRPPQGRRIAVAELPRLAKSALKQCPDLVSASVCSEWVATATISWRSLAGAGTGTRVGGARE